MTKIIIKMGDILKNIILKNIHLWKS